MPDIKKRKQLPNPPRLGDPSAVGGSVSDAAAKAAADEAIARLVSPSTHMTNTVWQFVYNLSRSGDWDKITGLLLPAVNTESKLKDLTGNNADATLAGTNPAYVAQSGQPLSAAGYFSLPWNLNDATTEDNSDYILGMVGTNFAPAASTIQDIFGVQQTTGGTYTKTYFGLNTLLAPAVGTRAAINGFWSDYAASFLVASFENVLISVVGIAASNSIYFRVGADGELLSNATPSGLNTLAASSAIGFGRTLNNGAAAGTGAVFRARLFYVAKADLNYTYFREQVDLMLDELTRTQPLVSYAYENGDSTSAGTGSNGTVGIRDTITACALDKKSSGAKFFTTIIAEMQGHLNAITTTDAAIIGGMINDIVSAPDKTLSELTDLIDDLVTIYDANPRLKRLFFKEITPIKGRYASQDDLVKHEALWQGLIDGVNSYVADLAESRADIVQVLCYSVLESSDPAYADYIEGTVNAPGGAFQTSGNKGNLTPDGLHYLQAGADILGLQFDNAIKAERYYKEGRD